MGWKSKRKRKEKVKVKENQYNHRLLNDKREVAQLFKNKKNSKNSK